jgi:hypothetical protein
MCMCVYVLCAGTRRQRPSGGVCAVPAPPVCGLLPAWAGLCVLPPPPTNRAHVHMRLCTACCRLFATDWTDMLLEGAGCQLRPGACRLLPCVPATLAAPRRVHLPCPCTWHSAARAAVLPVCREDGEVGPLLQAAVQLPPGASWCVRLCVSCVQDSSPRSLLVLLGAVHTHACSGTPAHCVACKHRVVTLCTHAGRGLAAAHRCSSRRTVPS